MNKSRVETLPCTTGRTAILQFRWSWNSVMNIMLNCWLIRIGEYFEVKNNTDTALSYMNRN
jgi:hypothetical protein